MTVSGVERLAQPYGLGRSFQQPVNGTPPAAGQPFVSAMEGRYVSRLVSCTFVLTTNGNVASRYATVEYRGGDGVAFAVSAAAVVVLAGTTQRFAGTIDRGTSEWAAGTDVLFPLSPVFLHPSDVLRINVAAMDAGDTLTAIRFVFDRFPTADTLLAGADSE